MRIVIAEDDPLIRLDLLQILRGAGHDVCGEARDGVEAVTACLREQPDLAILDVNMPRLDGFEAARRICEVRALPVLVLTGMRDARVWGEAVGHGIRGAFLHKPFSEAGLLAAVDEAARRVPLGR